MRRQVFIAVILGLLLTLNASAARGSVVLSFEPTWSVVNVGDSFVVDLVISRLGDLANLVPPLQGLGAYDLKVNYNPVVLTTVGVIYGSYLGYPNSLRTEPILSLGSINISESSFMDPLVQPETFVLATLSFNASAPGSSYLTFSEVILGDAIGTPIEDYSAPNGQVTVNAAVPLPSALWFLGSGAVVLIWQRRKATRSA